MLPPSLRVLDLRANMLTLLPAAEIATACPHLIRLSFACNRITAINLPPAGPPALPALEVLNLFGNYLSDSDPLQLLLAHCPAIKVQLETWRGPCRILPVTSCHLAPPLEFVDQWQLVLGSSRAIAGHSASAVLARRRVRPPRYLTDLSASCALFIRQNALLCYFYSTKVFLPVEIEPSR